MMGQFEKAPKSPGFPQEPSLSMFSSALVSASLTSLGRQRGQSEDAGTVLRALSKGTRDGREPSHRSGKIRNLSRLVAQAQQG